MDWVSENHNLLRLGFSIFGLVGFSILGLLFPFRIGKQLSPSFRWTKNISLLFFNALLLRFLAPLSLIAITQNSYLDNFKITSWGSSQPILKLILGIILLDFVIYWQHRLTHKIPLLWKLHRLHHSDMEFDTTTAGRFHTLEIFFSYFVKAFFIVIFDLSIESVIVFEILLNFSALFNHSNFTLPESLEKATQLFLITPHLHRIHHSTEHSEMNQNFGFSTSLWDRLFGTLILQSEKPQKSMPVGLNKFRHEKDQTFLALLKQPFLKE